jgi:hypothetical protein
LIEVSKMKVRAPNQKTQLTTSFILPLCRS